MQERLVVFLMASLMYASVSSQTLYSSSIEVGTRYNFGSSSLLTPKIAFDDISIANSLVRSADSIAVGKVNVGIRRTPFAPPTDVNIYYTPIDDTSTQQNTIIKIPPVFLGKATLPANGARSVTSIVTVGDGVSTLFKMKADTDRMYAGYHTFFIGFSLSNPNAANAISITAGPQVNKDYIVVYDADSTVQRFSASFTNFAATFYIQVFGISPVTLPLTLSNFKGELKESGSNDLSWNTFSETNSKGFQLERSFDGVTFDSIAFIASKSVKGTSVIPISYYYSVAKPVPGDNYYRLRQLDQDGRYTFSPVVLVKNENPGLLRFGSIFPNPARSVLNVTMAAPFAGNVHFTITDMSGNLRMSKVERVVNGTNNLTFSVGAFLPGTYTLKATSQANSTSVITGFIKQ